MLFRISLLIVSLVCAHFVRAQIQEDKTQQSGIVYLDCENPYDPGENVNRKIFLFNSAADYVLLRPIAKGYNNAMPKGGKTVVKNFFTNFYTPVTFINNILQLNFHEALKSFWKFSINSTIGILGIHDVASKTGLEVKKKNFGSTLAYYGVKPGPYIVLPLLGGTNFRDMLDVIILEKALNPAAIYTPKAAYISAAIAATIHNRAAILPITDNIAKNSLDPYATIRSMLHQKRQSEVIYPSYYKCKAVTEELK